MGQRSVLNQLHINPFYSQYYRAAAQMRQLDTCRHGAQEVKRLLPRPQWLKLPCIMPSRRTNQTRVCLGTEAARSAGIPPDRCRCSTPLSRNCH